jgi:hypothetical protein
MANTKNIYNKQLMILDFQGPEIPSDTDSNIGIKICQI